MRIGIDIDGVLTSYLEYIIKKGSEYCEVNGVGSLINPNAIDTVDMFGWDESTDLKFWLENIFDYATNNPPIDGASRVIKKLKEQGNTIYIITARWLASPKTDKIFDQTENVSEKMRNTVKDWLKRNEIDYDYIIFSEESKAKHIKDNKIDIMIDDSPKNIVELSQFTKVICFDWPYNRKIENTNFYRCYDWDDIYQKISEIFI